MKRTGIFTVAFVLSVLAVIVFAQTPSPSPSGSPPPSVTPTVGPTITPTTEPTSTLTPVPTQTPTIIPSNTPTPTTTPTTTPTPTPTGTPEPCTESLSSDPMQTIQAVYADDDIDPPIDLEVVGNVATVKQTLPMIKNKPTVLGGLWIGKGLEVKAKITAGPAGLEGKFEIDIPGAEPSKYESKKKYSLKPCETREFVLNPQAEEGGLVVSSIPFAHKKVKKDVEWTPLKTFEFKQTGAKEITLKFAGKLISKVVVEKVIETVPLRVNWAPMVFEKDSKQTKKGLVDEASARSKGDPFLYALANYPVENPKFAASSSQMPVVITGSLADWQARTVKERIFSLVGFAVTQSLLLPLFNVDRRVLVISEGVLTFPGRQGQSNSAGDKTVYVVKGAPSIVDAHEIAHTKPWRLDDEGNGYEAVGYLTTLLTAGKDPQRPLDDSGSVGFMANGGTFNNRIVRKIHYREKFIPSFDASANAKLDPAIWLFRGILEVDNSNEVVGIEPMPIYQFDGISDDDESCTSSPCVQLTIKTTLQDDSVVEKIVAINVGSVLEDFGEPIPFEFSPIMHSSEVPSQPIKNIVIEDEDNIIRFALDVTPNSPVLDILSVYVNNQHAVVTIDGSDVDGGSLFASLFVVHPDGTADAVQFDNPVLGETEFEINTEFLKNSDYTLVVLLTDGFNTVKETAEVHLH